MSTREASKQMVVTDFLFLSTGLCSCTQAARQAAQEKKAEVAKVIQEVAPPPAAEALPDPVVKKFPVGKMVSSVHVDYNCFEVGTGQVDVILTGCDR